LIGCSVRKTIVITLRVLSQLEELLNRALDAGVNHVQGIQFRTASLRPHPDEARALAINAVRQKVVALAGELGETVGNPVTSQEVHTGPWSSYGSWWDRGGMRTAQNVIGKVVGAGLCADACMAPGQINDNATMSVTFGPAD
jgi:hypothetical protein